MKKRQRKRGKRRKREKEKKRKREKEKKGKREKGEKGKREKGKKGKKEKGKKGKKRKRLTLEMASEGPQRITERYYGVYLPSYTIYPFTINLSIVIPLVIYPRSLFISDEFISKNVAQK